MLVAYLLSCLTESAGQQNKNGRTLFYQCKYEFDLIAEFAITYNVKVIFFILLIDSNGRQSGLMNLEGKWGRFLR